MVWVALVAWLSLAALALAVVPAAGAGDEAAPASDNEHSQVVPTGGRRRRLLIIGQSVMLAAAVAGAALSSSVDQWSRLPLTALLAVLVLGSDVLALTAKRFRIGGSFIGLVLAMALLGPAPAVAISLASAGVDGLRRHVRGTYLLNNLVTYATFPLLGGLVLHALSDSAQRESYALAVFGVFIAANALDFLMIAGHTRLLRGGSLPEMVRTVFLPVLPWVVASAVMTALAVYGFEVYGAGIIGLFALALGVYQMLQRALLAGEAHSAEIERRTDQLDGRHEGMLGLLLETLALRDPSAARHAAAVAHYAHELARAAGLSERERAVVHTAGLLHDLGKEALPDHILLGRAELPRTERRLIERHPADGARLLLRVEGMGEVAAAVLAHHERVDGRGYPDALVGERIPMTARILAVAEVYDVITAPDSYRQPLSAAEAEDELRQVAGAQLDGRLVWLFTTEVLRGRLAEHRGRIADLETELQVQRRVRGVLDQPFVLGPPMA